MKNDIKKMVKLIKDSEKILVISHRGPDADTLGSAIALKLFLSRSGKTVTLACIDKPSSSFSFLPCINEYVRKFDVHDYDLIVVVDAGASYMTDFHLKYPDLFSCGVSVVNIDHHSSNDNFGTVNIVDPVAPSVTYMLYKIFVDLGVVIDSDIATCLLAGIYGDTGSFMHSNTSCDVFSVSGKLVEAGASIADINNSLFRNTSVDSLRLWGRVFENAHITDDGVALSVVRDKDFCDVSAGPDNLSGVIDYLNMIPDAKFAVLLNEDKNGNVRGSFRTRCDDVDVSEIASLFGGGGHPKASGFSIPGKLKSEVRYSILTSGRKKSLKF